MRDQQWKSKSPFFVYRKSVGKDFWEKKRKDMTELYFMVKNYISLFIFLQDSHT